MRRAEVADSGCRILPNSRLKGGIAAMTAEIAILNTQAVALAADSAVTLTTADGQKIFTSAGSFWAKPW